MKKTGIGELNVCVKAAAKAKEERTLTWQLNGFGQLENCKVVGVLFYPVSYTHLTLPTKLEV